MEDDNIKTSRASQTREKSEKKKFGLHPHHLMHQLRQTATDIDGSELKH
jgi:hypothetical protein